MSLPVARGVRDRVVERVEVVVDELDLGPLGDREAEAEEDVLDLAPGRGEQVVAADRLGRRAGQRDVDAVGGQPRVELAGLELAAALLDQRLERLARLVRRPPDDPALLGRQLGDAAQQVRQLRLAPEEPHPHVARAPRSASALGDRRLGLGAELGDAGGRVGSWHEKGAFRGARSRRDRLRSYAAVASRASVRNRRVRRMRSIGAV